MMMAIHPDLRMWKYVGFKPQLTRLSVRVRSSSLLSGLYSWREYANADCRCSSMMSKFGSSSYRRMLDPGNIIDQSIIRMESCKTEQQLHYVELLGVVETGNQRDVWCYREIRIQLHEHSADHWLSLSAVIALYEQVHLSLTLRHSHIFSFTYTITSRYMPHTRSPLILRLNILIPFRSNNISQSFDSKLSPSLFIREAASNSFRLELDTDVRSAFIPFSV